MGKLEVVGTYSSENPINFAWNMRRWITPKGDDVFTLQNCKSHGYLVEYEREFVDGSGITVRELGVVEAHVSNQPGPMDEKFFWCFEKADHYDSDKKGMWHAKIKNKKSGYYLTFIDHSPTSQPARLRAGTTKNKEDAIAPWTASQFYMNPNVIPHTKIPKT